LVFFGSPAHSLEIWDDGGVHVVDTVVDGISVVRDSTGGAATTVNLVAGADVTTVNVEDSSILEMFAGSQIGELNYLETSSGTICGGEIGHVDLAGLPDVAIEGGTFSNIGAVVRVFGAESVVIQGGSFDTTGQANSITVSAGAPLEFRGGTLVQGRILVSGTGADLVVSGGNLGANGIHASGGAVVTIIGIAFDLCPVLPCQLKSASDGVFSETLIGTLADGSAINTPLTGVNLGTEIFLEAGVQGPLASSCGAVVTPVPTLPVAGRVLLVLALFLVGGALEARRQKGRAVQA